MQTVTLRERKKSIIAIIFSIILVLSMCLPYLVGVKAASADSNDKVVLGYYASWAPPGDDFDPNKITHLNYSFGDICWEGEHGNPLNEEIADGEPKVWPCTDLDGNENTDLPNGTIVMYEPEVDLVELAKVEALKEKNPNLKTLLSIGGWTLSHNLSDVAADEEARQVLAQSAVDFIREFNMDGLDVDWEYPAQPEWGAGHPGNATKDEDPENFILLLKDIREALDAAGAEDGKDYLVTIAGGQQDWFIDGLDLAEASKYLDYLAVMTYDTNGTWDVLTGHNAPLNETDTENSIRGWTNGNVDRAALKMGWAGVPANKIVIGLAFYGQAWQGCNPEDDGAYQAERGAHQECVGGAADINTGYGHIKSIVNEDGYKYFWDNEAKVPYLYNEDKGEFVSYDNIESLQYKVNYIKDNNLGGAMIWDLATDDAEWNLLKTVSSGLGISSEEPTPDPEQPGDPDPIDVAALEALIEEAQGISNDDELYTEASFANLQEAIAEAEAALDIIETEEELVAAIASLQAAIEELEVIEPDKVDTASLQALIEKAKEFSNDDEQYTESSFAELQEAIEEAESALAAIETEEELAAAIISLQAAIDSLEENEATDPVLVDVSDLEALIQEAKEISNDDEQYTESSFAALQEAIEKAESALATIETEEELAAAIASLQAAINGLEEVPEEAVPTPTPKPTPEVEDPVVEDGDDNGKKLPKTATNSFNFIAIGLFVLLIGGAVLFISNRRISKN